MINDLSQVLRNILDDPALPEPLRSAQIEFDHPTETYAPTGGLRTINVFLYDVRENVELRNSEPIIERLNGQARITRAPLRVECSYLITAWPDGTGQAMFLQEHQLLSQVLQALPAGRSVPRRVVYQDACHLLHAQRISRQPRDLLRAIPELELCEIGEAGLCCGSAGIYNVTNPHESRQLQQRKLDNALKVDPEIIVTANPGCLLQLRAGLAERGSTVKVQHLAELLDEASAP